MLIYFVLFLHAYYINIFIFYNLRFQQFFEIKMIFGVIITLFIY